MRDEKTRATMAHLINEGYPGGEAIETAMVKHAHFWDMEDKTVAADTSSSLASIRDAEAMGSHDQAPRGHKRPAETKGAKGNSAGMKFAQVDAKRVRICGAWNGKKGCRETCPRGQRHCCNIVAPDGKACEGRLGPRNHKGINCPLLRG